MAKKTWILTGLLVIGGAVFGLDFSIRPKGFVFIPAGPGNTDAGGNTRYDIGGGGDLGFELDLASLITNPLGLGYTAGIEGGMLFTSLKNPADGNVQIYSIGGSLGLYYFPLSRLLTRLDGAVGVHQGINEDGKGYPGLWWRTGAEAGFRFTPGLAIAANTGWRQFQSSSSGDTFNSGLYAGLTVQITIEAGEGSNSEGTGASLVQDDGVYPAFSPLYRENPAGTITVRNHENAEIRDVRVSFRAGNYTAAEFPCGTLSMIPKGRSSSVPLYADFSPDILRFTDTGRVLGEVVIRYRFLGKERQSVRTVSVGVHNRNTFPGIDRAALAAFISPNSPDVLEYSKYIIGLARPMWRSGLNQNMQNSVWLLEGLRAAGIRLDSSRSESGEIQFPAETLGFRTGNVVDLGLLYAAALESSSVPAALIPLEDDFIVACGTGVNAEAAETLFNGIDRVLVIEDQVWLPVSMNSFNAGFTAAWDMAVRNLNAASASGAEILFIDLEKIWALYPPAPLQAQGALVQLNEARVSQAAGAAIQNYIDRELPPVLQDIQRQLAANPGAALYNRQGLVLTRMGRSADAKAAFERASGMGSTAAMVNRGNISLNEKDYAAAERWFRQALAREAENALAKRGLQRIEERKE
jgi:hypothetical protein